MSDTNTPTKYPPLTNELFINFCEANLFSVYGTCTNVSTSFDIKHQEKKISLYITNLSQNNDRFRNIEDEFELYINAYNAIELKDYTYVIKVSKLSNLSIVGWIPRVILKSDAQILNLGENTGQHGVELDAPNLKKLSMNIESYKTLILSPETKSISIKTHGKEGYIEDPFDPRSYDYDPSIT